MRGILNAAAIAGTKVALHLEPYADRTVSTVKQDVQYIHNKVRHARTGGQGRSGCAEEGCIGYVAMVWLGGQG